MKRFYKTATATEQDGAYQISLDKRLVKTPLNNVIVLPSKSLAENIAKEWDEQGDVLDMDAMPLTQLAYTYTDKVLTQREEIIAGLIPYLETELICFYSENPPELYDAQKELWQPIADWFKSETGITLNAVTDIFTKTYSEDDQNRFKAALDALNDFELTALQATAALISSSVLSFALVKNYLDADTVFKAAFIEELHQAEQWGQDPAAENKRNGIKADLQHIAAFLKAAV